MMQKNVVILDIDYVTYEEKPVIRLFSKAGDENVILIDDTFEPYLYVMADDIDECMAEIKDNIDVVRIEKHHILHRFVSILRPEVGVRRTIALIIFASGIAPDGSIGID
jgi:DNA polymerase elongation subunit (family B)